MIIQPSNTNKSERGFAAIIIAITLVIITSLLVVGFARLMRNEQNQVTNRQLSNQAYYAAESGINDAAKALSKGFNVNKNICPPLVLTDTTPGASYLKNNNISSTAVGVSTAVQWTCLLIDQTPLSLEFNPVSNVTPKVYRFSGRDADTGTIVKTPKSISFSWQDASATNTNTASVSGVTNNSFPKAAAWPYIGMLRVSITPINYPVDRMTLKNSTYTAYLFPTKNSTVTSRDYNPGSDKSGDIFNGGCGAVPPGPRLCTSTITNLPSDATEYLVTMRSIYSPTNVSVSIKDDSPTPVTLRIFGAQTKIDSTGRSQDVLKRLQVRIPTRNQYYYPGFSAETAGDICKGITAYPGQAFGCGY